MAFVLLVGLGFVNGETIFIWT